MKNPNKTKWLKVIKVAIVGVATWLNPQAVLLLLLLELCFLVLIALREDDNQPKPLSEAQQTFLWRLFLHILAAVQKEEETTEKDDRTLKIFKLFGLD
jgi:hypothetical protein